MTSYDLAFKKPFTDFKKLIIGIVLSILPIIRWFSFGFILECSGLGKNKGQNMPEWTNWKDLFVKGFLATIIEIIYLIPALLVLFIFGFGMIISIIKTLLTEELRQAILSGASQETLKSILQQNLLGLIPSILKLMPILIVAGILGILAYYISPIAILNYLKNNKFEFAFKKIVFKKSFTGKYFIIWIIIVILTFIIGSILDYIPIFGYAITFFITGVFGYTLFGQVYLELEEKNIIKKSKNIKRK